MKPLNLIHKAFLLKKTALFGKLDLDLLLSISEKMDSLHFEKGEVIFKPQQEAHKMYMILEGKIEIHTKSDSFELSKGDFFGDEALFSEKRRAYEAVCLTTTTLLSLSRSHLLSIILECPLVGVAFLEAYTKHLDYRRN